MINNTITKIAIGSFDGIHLAHQRLISYAEAIVVIEQNKAMLTRGYRRSFYINKPIFIYHFEHICFLRPQEFVGMLKRDFPKLNTIIVGYDFEFGYKKSGNVKVLEEIFKGEVFVVKEVLLNNISIHSRTIKSYLQEGNVVMANRLLGRAYEMMGCVIKGQGIGSKELVSTINMVTENYLMPKEGVYASRIFVNDCWYDSISFIGHRASTDNSFAIETNIIGKSIELKSKHITLQWLEFIRPNEKFNDLKTLKAQILKDIEQAKKIHNER